MKRVKLKGQGTQDGKRGTADEGDEPRDRELDEKCRMREETRDTEKEKCDLQIHSGSDVHLTTF